jgi:hypothetical protein
MGKRLLPPYVLWCAIWVVIFMVILFFTVVQNKYYWHPTISSVETGDFNMLHSSMPYALAFLEEHDRPRFIQEVLDSSSGLFQMVYTDLAGRVKFATRNGESAPKLDAAILARHEFSYVYQKPEPPQVLAEAPREEISFLAPDKPRAAAYGKFYLIGHKPPSFLETLGSRRNWERAWRGEPMASYLFTVVSYLFVLFGFGLFCILAAWYQSRSREAREQQYEAEISALISKNESLELRAAHLDQSLKTVLKARDKAQKVLQELEAKLQDEVPHAQALENKLHKARTDYQEALKKYQAVEEELKEIDQEKKSLEARLEEAEKTLPTKAQVLRFRRLLESTWPNLVFGSKAGRQMDKLFLKSSPQKRIICHVLSLLEAYGPDPARLREEGVEVKSWQEKSKKKPRIVELKFPPSRIYLHEALEKICIVYLDSFKTERSQNDFDNFLATWRPCE